VQVKYDALKNKSNFLKHGIHLNRAVDFDLDAARYDIEDSQDYGEERWIAIGFLDARLHVLIFTPIEDGIRAISLRRADWSEERMYAED
jgi:uncharacterized protein